MIRVNNSHSHFKVLLRGGGYLGPWENLGGERVFYISVLLHFYDPIFLKSFEGVHEMPPPPPSLHTPCVHLGLMSEFGLCYHFIHTNWTITNIKQMHWGSIIMYVMNELGKPGGLDSHDQSRSRSRFLDLSRSTFETCQDSYYYFFVVVGLWSQSADKLTIHSIPCSWIL